MHATDTLVHEHEVIERVLRLLEMCQDGLRLHATWPRGFESWAVDFLEQFADGCHHDKEEKVLFPLLEKKGIAREGGPVGVMLREHELGRNLVRRMAQALPGRNNSPLEFAAAAEEYAALLRQHILKENRVLFPMADALLSAEDDAAVIAGFEAAAAGRCPCTHSKFECELSHWERVLDPAFSSTS